MFLLFFYTSFALYIFYFQITNINIKKPSDKYFLLTIIFTRN